MLVRPGTLLRRYLGPTLSNIYRAYDFIAAYRASDDTQNVGVIGTVLNIMPKGTTTSTSTHNTDILSKDADGIYQIYPVDDPIWEGGRVDLDPDKLWWSVTVTASTPDPLSNFRIEFNDGSTHREKYTEINGSYLIGDIMPNGVNATYRPGDGAIIDVYVGNEMALTQMYFHTNQLTGSLPDFSNNPNLTHAYFQNNQLTGSVPNFSNNPSLTHSDFHTNQLTGYLGGWPATAFYFDLSNNALTEAAVNLILTEADTYGTATGTTINLTGGTNAAPTGAGITAKDNLIANGATVTVNT